VKRKHGQRVREEKGRPERKENNRGKAVWAVKGPTTAVLKTNQVPHKDDEQQAKRP
jgi:hypothetical protein